jgi:hypothetical protein
MANEPEDISTPDPECPPHVDPDYFESIKQGFAHAQQVEAETVSAWEAEVEVFWQNVLLNVSAHVETPIHNFLHAEKEALKARLKLHF